MAEFLPDDIDWRHYERATEAKVKVIPASVFADQLRAQFVPKERRGHRPRMVSTKLGHCIEFREGEVTVWAGYNGHRKSMLAGQVSADLISMGDRTLIASLEMLPAVSLARTARQVFGVARPTDRQLDDFDRWTDGRLWMFNHLGRISPAQAISVVRYFAQELQGRHVFLDSMMMVCASEESLDEQKQFITDIVRVAQETGIHVHLVAHCKKPLDESKPPTKYDIRGSSAISDQVHNVCMVWANKAKKDALEQAAQARSNPDDKWLEQPDAMVAIDKQRNGSYEGRLKLWWDESSFRFTDSRTTPIEPYPIEADLAA